MQTLGCAFCAIFAAKPNLARSSRNARKVRRPEVVLMPIRHPECSNPGAADSHLTGPLCPVIRGCVSGCTWSALPDRVRLMGW